MNEEQIPKNPIESDINRVGQEVRERIGGSVAPEATERALVREALHPMVRQPSETPVSQPGRNTADDAMLPSYMKDMPTDVKDRVERLVEDAFKNGVEHAAIEAQKSGPFVVDALHDVLSDRFYEDLKTRKLI
jgi:hypothetical protein